MTSDSGTSRTEKRSLNKLRVLCCAVCLLIYWTFHAIMRVACVSFSSEL